ncbi:hypothetical protein STEG23_026304, partial [Scotinomys teguina]
MMPCLLSEKDITHIVTLGLHHHDYVDMIDSLLGFVMQPIKTLAVVGLLTQTESSSVTGDWMLLWPQVAAQATLIGMTSVAVWPLNTTWSQVVVKTPDISIFFDGIRSHG